MRQTSVSSTWYISCMPIHIYTRQNTAGLPVHGRSRTLVTAVALHQSGQNADLCKKRMYTYNQSQTVHWDHQTAPCTATHYCVKWRKQSIRRSWTLQFWLQNSSKEYHLLKLPSLFIFSWYFSSMFALSFGVLASSLSSSAFHSFVLFDQLQLCELIMAFHSVCEGQLCFV